MLRHRLPKIAFSLPCDVITSYAEQEQADTIGNGRNINRENILSNSIIAILLPINMVNESKLSMSAISKRLRRYSIQ